MAGASMSIGEMIRSRMGRRSAAATGPRAAAMAIAPPVLVLLLVLAVAHLAAFMAFAPATRIVRPYSDLYDLIDVYFGAERTRDWLGYLFQPHSYHRLPLFRSLLALDINLFKGSGIPFLVVSVLCMATLVVQLVRRALDAPIEALRIPLAAFLVMLLLTTGNAIHLTVPANTPYVHSLFFAMLAILLAEPADGASRSPFAVRRLSALACACGAALGVAVGFVLWPVLAFMAWRRGAEDRPWLILLLAVGGVFASLYLTGITAEDSAGALTPASLAKAVEYFFAFLGLPWVRAAPAPGRLIGVFMFACCCVALLRTGGPKASRYERVALAMVCFSLGVAALAAIGRRDIAEEVVVPGRYNLLLVPMKAGLVLLIAPWLERRWRAHRRLVEAGVVAVFAVYCLQQVVVGRAVAASAEHLRQTITAFQSGVRTEEMRLLIHPNLARAETLNAQTRARGLYQHYVGRVQPIAAGR
jgi:hypothetical protein